MKPRAAIPFLLAASVVVSLWVAGPFGIFGFIVRSPIILMNDLIAIVRQALITTSISSIAQTAPPVSTSALAASLQVTPPSPLPGTKPILDPLQNAVNPVVDSADNALTPVTDPVENAVKPVDRKSTRLNSSHQIISYAVFCLKKKTKNIRERIRIRKSLTFHLPHNKHF